MNIATRYIEDVVIIELAGDVDSPAKDSLAITLRELIDTGSRQVVIDLEQVAFMTSTGMSVFIEYLAKFRDRGGDLRMCRVQEDVMRVFRFTRLIEVFNIYDTVEDVVNSFSPWSRVE